MREIRVAFPVPVAIQLQMGKHAVQTIDTVDRFTRRYNTGYSLFDPVDPIYIISKDS